MGLGGVGFRLGASSLRFGSLRWEFNVEGLGL